MEQYALYIALKSIVQAIDSSFAYSFNDMDSNKGNVASITIKGGEASNYRTLAKGQYFNHNSRPQFLMQADLNEDSLQNMLSVNSKIIKTLMLASNTFIDVSSKLGITTAGDIVKVTTANQTSLRGLTVVILQVDISGDPVYVGKSEQGRPRYSINMRIKYGIGGN